MLNPLPRPAILTLWHPLNMAEPLKKSYVSLYTWGVSEHDTINWWYEHSPKLLKRNTLNAQQIKNHPLIIHLLPLPQRFSVYVSQNRSSGICNYWSVMPYSKMQSLLPNITRRWTLFQMLFQFVRLVLPVTQLNGSRSSLINHQQNVKLSRPRMQVNKCNWGIIE